MRQPRTNSRNAGFSLIETMLASVLLLVIIVGLVPLFMRSMVDNVSGRESSRATALSIAEIESLNAVPLDRIPLTVPGGSTELECGAEWDSEYKEWGAESCPPPTPTDDALWRRRTIVRQYSVRTLDSGLDATPDVLDDPQDGSIPGPFVHLREILIEVEGGARPAPPRQIDLATVRGF